MPRDRYSGEVSIDVDPGELADALERHDFAYLVTVSPQGRSHVVAVTPTLDGDVLAVEHLGRRTRANAEANPEVSLVWPPREPGDYSLIADGTAVLADDSLTLTPSRAVLHRSAPRPGGQAAVEGACGSDCVEL